MDPWSSSPLSVDVLRWQGWRRVHPFSGTSVICLGYCCCFSAGSDLGSLWEKGSLFPDHAAWWRYGGSAAPIPPPVLPSSWGPPYPLPAGVLTQWPALWDGFLWPPSLVTFLGSTRTSGNSHVFAPSDEGSIGSPASPTSPPLTFLHFSLYKYI